MNENRRTDMSIALTNAPALGGVASRVTAALAGLSARRARKVAYRQTRRELMALSDRELADIGLTRAGVDLAAAEAAIGSAH
jgi:uncharacterized protein YjiS (DUF1127 family)